MAKAKRKSKPRKKQTTIAVNPKTDREYQIESDARTLLSAAEVKMSGPRFRAAKTFLTRQQKAVQSVIKTPGMGKKGA